MATANAEAGLKMPITNGHGDSLSGFFHALVIVGMAAAPSLIIEKMMAMLASFVTTQSTSASADTAPQI